MKLCATLLALVLATPLSAQTLDPGPVTPTPWDDYILAAETFNAGDRVLGGCLFYRGQFRARLLLTAQPNLPPDGGPALFAALQEQVGRPINEWLAGDREDWINAMTCARDWAVANDDPDVPRARFPRVHADTLAGFNGLIDSIPPSEELRATRDANGLPNR